MCAVPSREIFPRILGPSAGVQWLFAYGEQFPCTERPHSEERATSPRGSFISSQKFQFGNLHSMCTTCAEIELTIIAAYEV